jgi:hypothetical protein
LNVFPGYNQSQNRLKVVGFCVLDMQVDRILMVIKGIGSKIVNLLQKEEGMVDVEALAMHW